VAGNFDDEFAAISAVALAAAVVGQGGGPLRAWERLVAPGSAGS